MSQPRLAGPLRALALGLLLAASTLSHAIFTNGGFENPVPLDNSTPWQYERGLSSALTGSPPFNSTNVRVTPGGGIDLTSRLGAATLANTDGVVRTPRVGSYSIIVNGDNTSTGAGTGKNRNYNRLRQQGVITDADRDPVDGRLHIRFAWAGALQDGGHGANDQPYLFLALRDVTLGNAIIWEEFVYATDATKFFTRTAADTTWGYTNWRNVDIVVPESSLGHAIEIDMLAAGCSAGGHGGYILFDAFGSELVPPNPALGLPVLTLSASSLSYTSPIGVASADQAFTVSNTGTGTLQLGTFDFTGVNAADYARSTPGGDCTPGTALAPGASCTIHVHFTPGWAGPKYAWLSIASNDTSGVVALQGNNGILTLSLPGNAAPPHDFGSLATGTTSLPVTITASNDGAAPLILGTISLTGAQAGRFAIEAGGTCHAGQTLAAAETCTILASFTPDAAGAFAASVAVTSNATNEVMALAGAGSAAVPGACGADHAIATFAPPSAALCAAGAASAVATNAGTYSWTCAGTGGGGDAYCAAPRYFTVSASSGANGTIGPSGPVAVMHGNSATFAVNASPGYAASVAGTCGGTLAGSSYTTNPVGGDCTVAASFTWIPLAQTTTVAPVPGHTFGDPPLTLAGTATSGLPVTYASTTPGVCSVAGAVVTILAPGTCTITASQPGDATWAAAPDVPVSFAVAKTPQAIAFAALAPRTFGDAPFSVVATSASGLAVAFASATPATCQVAGTVVTLLAPGDCEIVASQTGDANWAAAADVHRVFAIAKTPQSITFAPVADRTYEDPPVALVASVPSGLPVFFASATPAACTVSGSVVTLRGAGTCDIVASQAGDANWAAAPDVHRSFAIARAAQAIAFDALPNRTLGTGPFALPATGGASGLPVTFTSLTPATCRIFQPASVLLVGAGTCSVAADQAGNANYLPAPTLTRAFRIADNEFPVDLAIAPRVGVRLSTLVESQPFVVFGITGAVAIETPGGEHSVGCTGTYSAAPGLVTQGQDVCVRHLSAATPFTSRSTTVYVGSASAKFVSTTGRPEARLTLATELNPTRYRDEVAFVVTATGGYGPVTGRVSLRFGDEPVVGCESLELVRERAVCRSASLAPGVRDVVARHAGDEVYAWSEASLSHYVRPDLRTEFRDATGNGNASLYLQTAQGGLRLVTLDGTAPTADTRLFAEGAGWRIERFADFDGDGKADLVVRHDSGETWAWRMDGAAVLEKSLLFKAEDQLRIALVADFTGDGKDDLLVRDASGRYSLWVMNAMLVARRVPLPDAGPALVPILAADLDGDDHDDLVYQRADGRLRLQLVKDGVPGAFADVDLPAPGYVLTHAADLDGDYRTDLLLRGPAGEIHAWLMNGVRVDNSVRLSGPTAYRIAQVADFDIDGADDLLLEGPAGERILWLMDGARIGSAVVITDPVHPAPWQQESLPDGTRRDTSPADWTLVQVGDFNNDGKPDLVFVRESTGQIVVLLLEAQQVQAWGVVGASPTWRIVP